MHVEYQSYERRASITQSNKDYYGDDYKYSYQDDPNTPDIKVSLYNKLISQEQLLNKLYIANFFFFYTFNISTES